MNENISKAAAYSLSKHGLHIEDELINIIHQVQAAISILIGPRYIISVVNPKSLEIWGKQQDEVMNKPAFEVFPELISQGFQEILDSVYHTGKRFVANEAPVQLVRHGKPETIYVNFSYDPYFDKQGNIIGIISTGSDVSELVKAKQALMESDARSRMAIESAEMGTWDYDPVKQIIYCSDRTKELFGFRGDDEITLEMAINAIIDKDKAKVVQAIQNAMSPDSDGLYQMEYSIVNQYDGQIRTIKAKGKVFFESGQAHRFIGTALDITSEVKAKEEQQKLVTLVDNSIELMSVLEMDGKNSYINKAGMKMLGFDNDHQVLNTPISDLHTPEDIAFVESTVLPSVMSTGRWSGVMNVKHLKTGEVFSVFNNTVRIDDPITGNPIAIGAVMRDMRPEMVAQQELAESESKFRNVIEQAPNPILILKGRDMVLEVANQSLFELWNVGKEAIGKKFLEILPEMAEQGFMELLLKVYEQEQPHFGYEVPAVFKRNNGKEEVVYFNFIYQPFREANGNVSGVLVLATDVTAQVNAKNSLRKSEATLNLAVEAAQFGIYELDLVHEKIIHSPKAAEIFGLDPAIQWPFHVFVNAILTEDVHIREKAHREAAKSGNLLYELRILWPDASIHWIRLNGKIVMEDGIPVSSVGTVLDITQEKKAAEILEETIQIRTRELQVANESLERTNQQLEQFAHVASHDMKEPIRKISMFTAKLQWELGDPLPPQVAVYFDKITKAVTRLTNMVEGVLAYASISGTEVEKQAVDLKEVIQNIELDLELLLQQKNATIHYENVPQVFAVPFLTYQLFYNLINNSLKFARKDVPAKIEITCTPVKTIPQVRDATVLEQGYYEISVKDNGIGFNQENAEKIFKTFTRLHSKDQYEGTGLGLALCKSIVEKHHGYIQAYGEENIGAVMTLWLPVD